MRIWKLVVLLAGLAGVIGFFTPLIDYRSGDGRITGDASAFEIARGIERSETEGGAGGRAPRGIERSETGGGAPDGSADGAGGRAPRGIERSETGGGAGGRAPRGIERSETGGGAPDGSADGAGGRAPRGIDRGGDVRAQAEVLGLSRADGERISRSIHAGIAAHAGAIVACFVPAGLLAALGLLLMLRDRMGRLAGLCAIGLGGASAFVFTRFWQADQVSHDAAASLGLGVYLLLAAGLGGVLAGLGALISPDRG